MFDDFLDQTKDRIPNVREMLELCKDLGIKISANNNGEPVLRVSRSAKHEAQQIATLFRREPFRSEVLAATAINMLYTGPPSSELQEPTNSN